MKRYQVTERFDWFNQRELFEIIKGLKPFEKIEVIRLDGAEEEKVEPSQPNVRIRKCKPIRLKYEDDSAIVQSKSPNKTEKRKSITSGGSIDSDTEDKPSTLDSQNVQIAKGDENGK